MKLLSVIPFLLGAGIAISQVSAAPLRVVVVSEHIKSTSGFIRIGHAATNTNPNVATLSPVTNVHMRPKHGCAGSLRNKATQLSNWFLVVFRIRPVTPNVNTINTVKATEAVPYTFASQPRPHTFSQRLTHALMMLGPWEGRAIAFILGCGIGVLVRMFWVLSVLAFRSVRGKRQREEFIEDEILFEEDQRLLAPPQYAEEYALIVEEKEKEVTRET